MLPQGTVTFLFTDIEGSTRLWEEQTAAMQISLARHDQILQSVVKANTGSTVKTTGDGMLAVFRSATDAVHAAADAQRLLNAEEWQSEIGRLSVRMALHSGVAQLRGGDYYGPAANRAARLLDAVHGDQILLSSTTHALVQDNLPQDAFLIDMGRHKLRDIPRPERIYQLVIPGFQREFPPLKTQSAQPNNLPKQTTPFVGRVTELTAVAELLQQEEINLVTLTGFGGSGKTRLAVKVAANLFPDFTDGVFFVDLAPLTGLEFIPSAIAGALSLRSTADQDLTDIIRSHLRHLEVLLILDNFEHLLHEPTKGTAVTDLVIAMLADAPNLKLLITSRETLNLPGEWQYPVGGLEFPETNSSNLSDYDAVQLFDICARRVRPGFSLSNEADGVMAICRAVEGIPLAIKLAATWVNSLDTIEIAAEIQRNIDILTTSQRSIPQRHSSMQAVFEYSWNLLDPRDREIFRQLSVFRGGFSRDAAARVAGASLPALSSHLDNSLLHWEGGRYYVHGLLRQYAADQLESEAESQDLRDIHCMYYANFVTGRFRWLLGGKQYNAKSEIQTEIENIRIAWKQAVETININAIYKMSLPLNLYYQMQNQYQEAQGALQNALRKLETAPTSEETDITLAAILIDYSWIAIRLGHLTEAETTLDRCLEIYGRLNIPPIQGQGTDPRLNLAIIALIKGEYATAEQFGNQALQISIEHDHPSNRQIAYYVLTRAALVQGHFMEAQQYATRAYATSQEMDDRWFMAYCLNELGNVASAQGNYPGAADYYETSYALREEFDDAEGMAAALMRLGEVDLQIESFNDAQRSFERAEAIYEEIYDKGGLAAALNFLGRTAVAKGDFQKALNYFRRALNIACEIQFMPLILSLLVGIGRLFMELGQKELGLELLSFVAGHQGTEYDIRIQAKQIMAEAHVNLDNAQSEAVERGRQGSLDQLLDNVRSSLLALQSTGARSVSETRRATPKTNQTLVEPLTPRELEVLDLIAEGLTNRQIAEQLYISIGTVKSYTSQIYGKLAVGNRTQAVSYARIIGLMR
jgi:predicted ATPase/class 3 adenylate cyclase/DNA-binding CsgD family transcriptional regulator/Flp pilus assembly protein TadD